MKILGLVITMASLVFTAALAHAATFYVSPSGSDANPGTFTKPFASIARAQIAARKERRSQAVTVEIRGGTYALSSPIEFGPADSGSPGKPVVYQAYRDEKPILSGATPLRLQWEPYKNGIFQASVAKPGESVPEIDQLFVNNVLMRMARYPNYDPSAKYYHGTSADATSPARVKSWADPTGGYVHGLHQYLWGSYDYQITGKNDDGSLEMVGGWQNNRPGAMSDSDRFVENIFEELDAPGEWYLNRKTGVLYLMPPAGVALSHATITGSISNSLVEFRGTESVPVKHITLKGLVFTQTSRTFMLTREPLLRSDWRIYRGGVAFFAGATDCAIRDSDFVDVGGNAVFVSGYNRRVSITGCKIAGAGASGICFVGSPRAVRSPLFQYDQSQPESAIDTRPGPATEDYPADCLAQDNLITKIGEIEKQAAGVEIDIAREITVSHCSIYNVPRSGINIGDGCWGGHVITECDVFNTVNESGDHGSFNSWGRDRYWNPDRDKMNRIVAEHPDWFKLDAIEPITLCNTRWVCRHGWDIDLDDGSTNYIIKENLCLGGGIKNREGAYRSVENNVLVGSTFHSHVWFDNSHDVFAHNIVMEPYQPIGMPAVWGSEIDNNLLPNVTMLKQEQAAGRDTHSVSGDPEFLNAAIGDYRVKSGSPALAVGFVNFPMDTFGVTSPRLRAQAQNGFDYAVATQVNPAQAVPDAGTHIWMGAIVKTVTSLGEQSAAGLPEARGVIVLSVPTGSPASALGLRNLDVIWTVDGDPVRSFADLSTLLDQRQQRHTLGFFHGQKLIMIKMKGD